MPGESNTTLHALTITYVVVLLGLAAFAVASYFIPQEEYRTQRNSDVVLRTAVRQETLLERASFWSYLLVTAREPAERRQPREKLSQTVKQMQATQRALLEGDPTGHLQGKPPPSVLAIYSERPFLLGEQMRRFEAEAAALNKTPEADLSTNNPHFLAIRAAAAGELSEALEAVVEQYQQVDDASVKFLLRQEIGTLVATLILLLITGTLVFRPMVRRLRLEQDALRESERRMATLLNNLPGAAYRLPRDHDGTMAYVSEGIVKLTEHAPAYFLRGSAEPFVSLILPEDRQRVRDAVRLAVKRDNAYVIEYRIRTRTGKERWLWEKGVCVRDPRGEAAGLEGFIEDITQWKRAEEAQLRAERLAAIGSMAAKLAHEIRNPLSTIKLNLDLLGDEVGALGPASSTKTDEARTLLQAINSEVLRVQRVAEDYLQFSRLPKLQCGRVRLNQFLARELAFLRPMFTAAHVAVATEFTPALPAIQADPDQLWQAILNLIRNAVEAMPQAGTLTLRTARTPDEVVLHLIDTGKGMTAEERSHLFRPFFTTKPAGTGLGLTLTQQIISEHGGHIECASVAGQGTTFSLRFPSCEETAPVHEC